MVLSTDNPKVKRIRLLHHRKHRDAEGLYLAEGIRLLVAAEKAGAGVESVIIAPELLRSDLATETVESLIARGADRLEISARVFHSISDRDNPAGVAFVGRQRWACLDDAISSQTDRNFWVALSGTQDPGNIGTVLRTCDAVGGAGLILVGSTADPFHPKALRASMGSALHQMLVRTQLQELSMWVRSNRLHLVGTSGSAPNSYRHARYRYPLVLFMGSEREGMSQGEVALCESLVSIPMTGFADSLNLGVAAGVVLYEIFHQRSTGET